MNKYLLYVCSIAIFCLACAKETKEDNLFIESILLESDNDQKQIDTDTTLNVFKTLNAHKFQNTSSDTNEIIVKDNKAKGFVDEVTKNQSPEKLLNTKSQEEKKSKKAITENKASNNSKKETIDVKPWLKSEDSSKVNKADLISNSKVTKPKGFDTIRLKEVSLFKRLNKSARDYFANDNNPITEAKKQSIGESKLKPLSYNEEQKLNQRSINKTSAKKPHFNNKTTENKELINNSNKLNKDDDTPILNKNQTTYRILYDDPKVTKLFTDPSEHGKRYNKPKTIEIKKSQVNYPNKRVVKEAIVQQSVPKNNKNDNSNIIETNSAFANIKTKGTVTNAQNKNLLTQNNESILANNQLNWYAQNKANNDSLKVRVLNKKTGYKTNKTYTLIAQITNKGQALEDVHIEPYLPKEWRLISVSKINGLKTNERKVCLISFYIPTQFTPGEIEMFLAVKSSYYTIKDHEFTLNIEANYGLDVFNLTSPKQLQAGELIESTFGIKNNGNTDQEINLSTRNNLVGENTIVIPRDSTIIVKINQKTDKKANSFRRIGTNLEVTNIVTKEKYYKSNSTDVIPSSIKQKDPYFRYLMDASLYYSSYTKKDYHYSIVSAELKGDGFLDLDKNHHLNFIIRAPKKQNLRRFNVVDQYSLIYRYKDSTTIYLGDHAYDINRLGYGNRYGMGFRIDHNIKKWKLSAFYSKPRLYDFNNKPLYGFKAVYNQSDSIKVGIAVEKSEGNNYSYQNIINQDGKGQIATLDYYYKNNNTYVDAEMSASFNSSNLDYASRLDFTQRFKGISFNSTLTYAGKNYLGTISNSLQLSTGLTYYKNRFNFGLGHAVSKVNRRLDPTLFEVEPYYENFFATFGYRFGSKHNVNFRFDKRIREDQLDPVNYKYQEYGFDYRFNYTDKLFTGSFGGRFAKTQNLLIGGDYRNTYTNDLNVSYRILNNLSLRGALNHTLTNRYGYSGLIQNYYRYNFGFNFNASRSFRVSANYNSGFSPEENYRKRDYINLNLNARINQRHRLQIRANYYENPSVLNNKELQAFAKYTYSFGVGLKRLFEQGGIEGFVTTNDTNINTKGIKMFTNGKTVVTDKYGNFELNNLEVGANYIYLDESSLPMDIVLAQKNPIEVIVEKNKKTIIDVLLVKAGEVLGSLNLSNKNKALVNNLESYVKLENEDFTYYAESDKNGSFIFKNIVPGDYTFSVIRFKNSDKLFSVVKNTSITVPEAVITELNINVKGKERKIRFKNNNLKVAYYD